MVQENNLRNKILIICGPTASGKTALAIECAKLLDTEIISADSMYIYKNLSIGTAKPTIEEMSGIKHHLIDVVEPIDNFSVSDYKNLATPIINSLIAKNKIPIICGGTGFYINSILYDLSYGNGSANIEIREKYKELAKIHGNEYVFSHLKSVDPQSAEKLHFNDLKRVIRALEIYYNGEKKSEIKDDFSPKYDYLAYSINHDRKVLYDRINRRVDKMLSDGLLDEIKGLINDGVSKSSQCMQAIGYKEVFEYLEGNVSLEQAIELIKLNSRHYAKRQLTFFKKYNLIQLEPNDVKILARNIVDGANL